MKRIVCEMCGSSDVIKQDGLFVCQSCWTKYSVEEAKKMMIEGTVRVDNSHLIENYLEMAYNAYGASNSAEAESYCNKIIEIEPTNYKAWMLKGKAAGWQSTLQNSRVSESVSAFSKAIQNAPEEEKEGLVEDAKEEIVNLSRAMLSLRGERFEKWPDEEESAGFMSDITSILNCAIQFISQAGVIIPVTDIMAPAATIINQSVVSAWKNKILPDYKGDPNDSDDRPGKYEWQTFIERIGYCTSLLEKAIDLCDDDDKEDIQRYENLIHLHEQAIDSCSWDYDYTDYGKRWYKEWQLTDQAKSTRRSWIRQYQSKIATIKSDLAKKEAAEKAEKERKAREEAKKRFDDYWAKHADEKVRLESERKGLQEQIVILNTSQNEQVAKLNQEIAAIPGQTEINSIDERIKKLSADKDALGLFKGKEKKALQEQINQAEAAKKAVQDRMAAAKKDLEGKIASAKNEIQRKVNTLQEKIDRTTSELIKPR